MKTRGIKYVLLILITLTLGCKEEFLLSSKSYEQLMVVDGFISNEPGPYTVSLYHSSPVNDPEVKPYPGCIITMQDNTGYSEVLTEIKSGTYITSETGIRGIIGNKYSISIISPNGKQYQTEPQELLEPVGIDSVYAELIYKKKIEFPYGLPGYQFYTDTKTATNQTYLLWNFNESYQYTADYKLYAIYYKQKIYINNIDTITGYDSLYRCWKTEKVNSFFTGKTSNLTVPKITHQPILFVSTESKRLTERYSLLLKQYTIGKEAYLFWESIQDQTSNENFLFVNQPFNIIGNVRNINNQAESVLGYFTVGSVDQKRMFINRPYVPFYYKIRGVGLDIGRMFFLEGPFLLALTPDGQMGKVTEDCLDCTYEGGVTKQPTFWVGK